MPNWCVVAGCPNSSKKVDRNGQVLRFFRFPADKRIQDKWRLASRRNHYFNVSNARICSEHFTNDDYEDALRARLMGKVPVRLKKTAVPTQHLSPLTKKKAAKPVPEEVQIKKRKQLVEQLLKEHTETIEVPEEAQSTADSILETVEDLPETEPEAEHPAQAGIEAEGESEQQPDPVLLVESVLEGDVVDEDEPSASIGPDTSPETLLARIKELETENLELLQLLRKKRVTEARLKGVAAKAVTLEKVNEDLRKKLEASESRKQPEFDKKVKELFKDCLSPNQIDIMLKKKTKARWTQEEFSKAFTLRYLSQRSYSYVKDTLNYPLPGLSTLRKWASLSQLKSGVLDDVFRIMQISGQNKSAAQRCTVLSFSEMKVASVYEYNDKEDDIIGPHNYMQVIMAQGLFDNWKQPVYVEFDKKINKEILLSIITKLDTIGFSVVACTCNCSGVNQGIWKEFGVSMDSTYIAHPTTGEKIHFFADPPSLLKLLRNWFLDTGFLIQGKLVTKDPVAALINIPADETISSRPILTTAHITCEEVHRANFRLAKDLFSHSTAMALQRHLPGDREQAQYVASFVLLINNWFDILTVGDTDGEIPTKKPYGVERDAQFHILEEMVITMKNMIRVGKNSLQIFQKAVIITCKSLEELFKDMVARHGINYILTARLNQDCLEKFCALLRTGYVLHEHPSPKIIIKRLRQILLGKKFDTKHANAPEEPDEYLITQTLIQAEIDVPIECSTQHDEDSPREKTKVVREKNEKNRNGMNQTSQGSASVEATVPTSFSAPCNSTAVTELEDLLDVEETAEISPENAHIVDFAKHLAEKYLGLPTEKPTKQWLNQVELLEAQFCQFHSQPYADPVDVLAKKTYDFILSKYPPTSIDPRLVELFIAHRMSLPELANQTFFHNQGVDQIVVDHNSVANCQVMATSHQLEGFAQNPNILKRMQVQNEDELAKRMRPMIQTL